MILILGPPSKDFMKIMNLIDKFFVCIYKTFATSNYLISSIKQRNFSLF